MLYTIEAAVPGESAGVICAIRATARHPGELAQHRLSQYPKDSLSSGRNCSENALVCAPHHRCVEVSPVRPNAKCFPSGKPAALTRRRAVLGSHDTSSEPFDG
jgi:hypothetical protein